MTGCRSTEGPKKPVEVRDRPPAPPLYYYDEPKADPTGEADKKSPEESLEK